MVNNWGDHDSSDDESIIEKLENDPELQKHPERDSHEAHPPKEEGPRPPRTYEFPTEPPYMAYIGNLDWNLTDSDQLAKDVTDLVLSQNLMPEFRVQSARILMDHRNQHNSSELRSRGFGYIELETLEMLQEFMKINDGDYLLSGRRLQVDTATQKRRGNNNHHQQRRSQVDGSKFRGGKYQRNHNQKDPSAEGAGASDTPKERPKLALKPRSKPAQGTSDAAGEAATSTIFGGAKPRDELNWRDRPNKADTNKHSNTSTDRKGRGATQRGGGNKSQNKKDWNRKQEKPEKTAAAATATKPAPTQPPAQPTPKEPKVTNAFAALDMGDSDSD